MAKTKKEKKALLEKYKEKIQSSKGIVFIRPRQLFPNETNEFKKEIFDSNAQFNVVKNSIFKMALKETNMPEIESLEGGEHAVLFMQEDIVTPSKSLKKFIKNTQQKDQDPKVVVISGIYEGTLLTKDQVEELAEMPDKAGSVSLILGILDNALSGVLNVLEDAPRSYAYIIDQAFKE